MFDLIPVPLHRHTLFVAKADAPLMPLRPICDALGLAWAGQHQKLQSHPTFAPTVMMIMTVGADGKEREMLSMPADLVMGWLLTIHPGKVAPRARGALVEFQRHIFRAAYDAWMAARSGLPVHAGGRPRQETLFEPQNPMEWLKHPTIRQALTMWEGAAQVEAEARERANALRTEARQQARRVGLSGKAFAALRDWAELAPFSPPGKLLETEHA